MALMGFGLCDRDFLMAFKLWIIQEAVDDIVSWGLESQEKRAVMNACIYRYKRDGPLNHLNKT